VERVKREIEEYVHAAAQLDPWLRDNPPAFDWKLHWPPAQTEVEHPIVRTMLEADFHAGGEGRLGEAPTRIHGFCAVCDAAFLNAGGVPSVIYGPGTVLVAHSVNEYVDVDDLVDAAKGLAMAALRWCATAG
jgi:acetylornithine deacetylase